MLSEERLPGLLDEVVQEHVEQIQDVYFSRLHTVMVDQVNQAIYYILFVHEICS